MNAPLGSFSARIAAAHTMGLISDREKAECDLIRKVRNEFAHKVKMSFDNPRVRDLCSGLSYSVPSDKKTPVSTRSVFSTASVLLIVNLTNRPHYVGQKRLKHEDWAY
jgi:mannitol operon repressor